MIAGWYFDGEKRVFKVLRFLNLLEPDRVVLDITKLTVWASVIQSFLLINFGSATMAGTSLGLTALAAVKHEVRRFQMGRGK